MFILKLCNIFKRSLLPFVNKKQLIHSKYNVHKSFLLKINKELVSILSKFSDLVVFILVFQILLFDIFQCHSDFRSLKWTVSFSFLSQDSKHSNNSTLASSLVSAYSFGDPSLRPIQEWIENRLYLLGTNWNKEIFE